MLLYKKEIVGLNIYLDRIINKRLINYIIKMKPTFFNQNIFHSIKDRQHKKYLLHVILFHYMQMVYAVPHYNWIGLFLRVCTIPLLLHVHVPLRELVYSKKAFFF